MVLNIVLTIFIVFSFAELIFAKKKETSSAITISDTYAFRGISILFIVMHHICQRVSAHNIIQIPFLNYVYLFVAAFFFFSGYGNYLSLKKQPRFAIKWLLKRICNLLFFFLIGLLINVTVNNSIYENGKQYLFDLITLTYRPYTLWFFKVIFITYFITFILQLTVHVNRGGRMVISMFILSALYIILCVLFKIPSYWWNSIIGYSIGCLFAEFKDTIKVKRSFILLFVIFFIITSIIKIKIRSLEVFSAALFCVLIALYFFNYTFRTNKFINCVGKISLGMYLYHTLLLTAFKPVFNQWYTVPSILVISFVVSLLVDLIYKKTIGRLFS